MSILEQIAKAYRDEDPASPRLGPTQEVSNEEFYWAIDEYLLVDGAYGKEGRWYECRQVKAPTRREAILKAFPQEKRVPKGYRIRSL